MSIKIKKLPAAGLLLGWLWGIFCFFLFLQMLTSCFCCSSVWPFSTRYLYASSSTSAAFGRSLRRKVFVLCHWPVLSVYLRCRFTVLVSKTLPSLPVRSFFHIVALIAPVLNFFSGWFFSCSIVLPLATRRCFASRVLAKLCLARFAFCFNPQLCCGRGARNDYSKNKQGLNSSRRGLSSVQCKKIMLFLTCSLVRIQEEQIEEFYQIRAVLCN